MSSKIAIKVEGLSKRYQIYDAPQDRLKQFLLPKLRKFFHASQKEYSHQFWALQDISFEIKKGETVGVIGRNGCGKSTLLQLICGILNPTYGNIKSQGRVAALLELGSGFNLEFSGRDNIYLNAALLGLTTKEIDERFDRIVAFADIGRFLNQPVKTYSSGMYVRLAFSIAISTDPDILIVDEALAVGDEPFQRKCYSRIEQLREQGTSILLVTHSGGTVTQMCSRALLLDEGERLYFGDPKVAVENYYRLVYSNSNETDSIKADIKSLDIQVDLTVERGHSIFETITTSQKNQKKTNDIARVLPDRLDRSLTSQSAISYTPLGAEIISPYIENAEGKVVNVLNSSNTYWHCYDVNFLSDACDVSFSMLIKTTTGIELGAIGSSLPGNGIPFICKGSKYKIRIPFKNIFSPGVYFLNVGCKGRVHDEEIFLHRIVDAHAFRVECFNENHRYAGPVQIYDGSPELRVVLDSQ